MRITVYCMLTSIKTFQSMVNLILLYLIRKQCIRVIYDQLIVDRTQNPIINKKK